MKVTINGAMTIDGKISTAHGDSAISSKEDLKRVHRLRAASDAIIVGISTVFADDPKLTVRLASGKNPLRVVVDSKGRIPSDSRLLLTAHSVKTLVAVSEQASALDIERIKKSGADVAIAGNKAVDLETLFSSLENMGLERILVEGGGELNWSVLRLDLADELIVTIAPRIAGGRLATTLVEGDGYERISSGPKLELVRLQRTKNAPGEIVLFFKVNKKRKIHRPF